jgi:two-component system sensor kinase FixL
LPAKLIPVLGLPDRAYARTFIQVIVVENTDRNRLEREMRERVQQSAEAEERMRSVVNHVVDGIISIDERGTVTTFNPAAERIFSYSAIEVIGQNIKLLMPEPFHSQHDGYIANYLLTGHAKIIGIGREVIGRRKEGSTFPMDLAISVFRIGEERYFTGIVRDITKRKRAEEELREAGERMRSIVDHVIDGIITIDEHGTVESLNPAAQRLFGYPATEVIGRNVKLLMPEPFHGEHDGYLANYVQTGKAKIIGIGREVVGRRKDGSTFPMDLAVSAFHLEQRRFFTGIVRDISDRKRAESNLLNTAEELARSNLDLEQFAYVASHDLQEPLRAVAGCVQVLQKRYQGQLDGRADELIAHTVAGVSRMQALIDDLLSYSRVSTRGGAFETCDCEGVLEQAGANLEVALKESGTVLTHDALPTVMADAAQLTHLFQNLISNAIKFRNPEPPKIHVAVRSEDDLWVFSVTDNGIGMQPEYFERIFIIFQRLHTRNEYPGTGIGLAICKKIVERHGGRIWVDSEPGRGSTFHFTIPAKA